MGDTFNLWADQCFTELGREDRRIDEAPAITIYNGNFACAAVFGNGKGSSADLTKLIVAAPKLLRFAEQIGDHLDCCKPGENGVNLCQHRECEVVRAARNLVDSTR